MINLVIYKLHSHNKQLVRQEKNRIINILHVQITIQNKTVVINIRQKIKKLVVKPYYPIRVIITGYNNRWNNYYYPILIVITGDNNR